MMMLVLVYVKDVEAAAMSPCYKCDFIIVKASLDWFIPDPLKTRGSPNIFIAPHLIVYHGAVGSASLSIKTSKHLVAEILST